MTVLIALLLLAAAVGVIDRLVRTVAADGYGRRPGPSSHPVDPSWLAPASLGGRDDRRSS